MPLELRDIERKPPSKAFLEQHVDRTAFLDFVSRRSPVFKQRPLPRSRREAIELMMAAPKLIRRPVLVAGRRVVFGFDKAGYTKAVEALRRR